MVNIPQEMQQELSLTCKNLDGQWLRMKMRGSLQPGLARQKVSLWSTPVSSAVHVGAAQQHSGFTCEVIFTRWSVHHH